jgi:hypothetical protein
METGIFFNRNEYVKRAEVAYSVDKALWSTRYSGVFYSDSLIKKLDGYNNLLNQKYNSLDSNMEDLKSNSFGGQLTFLDAVSRKNILYEKLGVRINRDITLSNSRVSLISGNLAKVTFNYNLNTKMYIRNTNNSSSNSGMISFFVKKINDKWLIYNQEETIKTKTIGKLNMVWDYESRPK